MRRRSGKCHEIGKFVTPNVFHTIRKQFEEAIRRLQAGAGYAGVAESLDSLSSVERGMLQAAVSDPDPTD